MDDAFPQIYAAGDVIEAGPIKNARSAVQQAQVVADNIICNIRGQRQIEYRQQWWEGTTKLTLGTVSVKTEDEEKMLIGLKAKSVVYITDHSVEVLFSTRRQRVELDSAMVWKYLGVNPYVSC